MNKTIVIAGIVILVLIGGGLFVANQQSQNAEQAKMAQESAMAEKEAMQAKEGAIVKDENKDAMMKKEDDKMMTDKNASRYVEYSKTTLNQAAFSRRVLYFYANWCPICKPADADFRTNSSKIPADVTVIRVNYNDTDTDQEEKDLAKKYGITYQHTFVQIDEQGKQVTIWNGGKTDELFAKIK